MFYPRSPIGFFEQGTLHILPPVTGAVQEILLDRGISIEGKNVVIVGAGGRVGKPTAIWAKRKGANVTVLSKQMFGDGIGALQQADIIISERVFRGWLPLR